jgi:nucleotidyltransferase substrate binding protein (TIGR01987 family)
MEKIVLKLEVTQKALISFERSIVLFEKQQKKVLGHWTHEDKELLITMRDSMIYRFEYSVELFFRVLENYLEEIELVDSTITLPSDVIRDAVKTKLLSEIEGDHCLEMVMSRNETSHGYHEETAEAIAQEVPGYYRLMNTIVARIADRID